MSKIPVCPSCGIKVIPKSDGSCPNCKAQISVAETDEEEVSESSDYKPVGNSDFQGQLNNDRDCLVTDELAKHSKRIRLTAICAAIGGIVTLLIALTLGPSSGGLLSYITIPDSLLCFGLAYGIWKENRWAALAMLIVFVVSQIFHALYLGLQFRVLAPVLLIVYVMGTISAFKLRKIKAQELPLKD